MEEPLVTERLRLRPFRIGDLRALHAMWSDPAIGRWVGGTHTRMAESRQELAQHMDHQRRFGFSFWAVEERDGGALVGEVGLMMLEGRGPEIEIGWCLGRSSWGRGYAVEAAEAWLQAGFAELDAPRIIAAVLEDNHRSRRVCEKLGMVAEGRRSVYGAEHLIYVRER